MDIDEDIDMSMDIDIGDWRTRDKEQAEAQRLSRLKRAAIQKKTTIARIEASKSRRAALSKWLETLLWEYWEKEQARPICLQMVEIQGLKISADMSNNLDAISTSFNGKMSGRERVIDWTLSLNIRTSIQALADSRIFLDLGEDPNHHHNQSGSHTLVIHWQGNANKPHKASWESSRLA